MGKTITVFWKATSRYENLPFRLGECTGCFVKQRGNVSLLIIREENGLRHEIPLDNVLYWSVDTAVDSDSLDSEIFDRYCDSCKTYFSEDGTVGAYAHRDHDVRRTCCGASPHDIHHPSCTQDESEGNQRVDTIVGITEDDDGLSFRASFDPSNPASPFFGLPDR